jgi:vacuolar-type H+-ATPase subunit H
MQDFRFYIDQKITTWQRVRFTIQATTEEEATEKAKEFLKEPDECPEESQYEIIHEANQDMSVEENEGNATRELYNENGQEIANNTEE